MRFDDFRSAAFDAGFCDAGLCSVSPFDEQRTLVLSQPEMKERRQLRFFIDDPQAKSLAVLIWPYKEKALAAGRGVFVDSYYEASNSAYHAAKVLEEKLRLSGVYAKANVPYPAKEAAMRCGMGIIGKNSLLIHPVYGSRVIIILMLTDMEPQADKRSSNSCLGCDKCMRICPTGAIDAGGMSHPERCLRNYMMEGEIVPESIRPLMRNTLLGCDLCQRVCPMQNHTASTGTAYTIDDFLTEDNVQFSHSIRRLAAEIGKNAARPQRVRAQLALICGNRGGKEDLPVLKKWADSEFDAVKSHSLWAIRQIESRAFQSCSLHDTGLDQSP